ncbi:VanZ family protein [Salisediminibacterium selenitireducens]|uniref:VanZ family protein n=1 Tax=Bacillus selenitireducens (strain ATCC 700615 / DSM 15326 / MLS10) TaxID=439292 RepID=D6Y0K6_BACIE|nr:VanZ family protein [Salisediminibacterium selenitireducens]ADI00574.1 VanZ family protein [[Bacillus] selenitireducens MLS10]
MHKKLSWLAVILWMGLIFFFSHQPGDESAALSGGITRWIHTVLTALPLIDFEIGILHTLIRKSAHFFVYLILGVLVLHALLASRVTLFRASVYAWFIATAYAATDEYHQTFIPGRVGDVMDVVIDSLGAMTGILIYLLVYRIWRWRKQRNRS